MFLLRWRTRDHHSNCLHNLCYCNSHKVVWQIFNTESGTLRARLTDGSRVGIKSDTAGDYFIILIWPSLWAISQPSNICGDEPPHLSVHEHGLNAKERSHSHSWDNLCVWVWWPWGDADATCLWEHTAKQDYKDNAILFLLLSTNPIKSPKPIMCLSVFEEINL